MKICLKSYKILITGKFTVICGILGVKDKILTVKLTLEYNNWRLLRKSRLTPKTVEAIKWLHSNFGSYPTLPRRPSIIACKICLFSNVIWALPNNHSLQNFILVFLAVKNSKMLILQWILSILICKRTSSEFQC